MMQTSRCGWLQTGRSENPQKVPSDPTNTAGWIHRPVLEVVVLGASKGLAGLEGVAGI